VLSRVQMSTGIEIIEILSDHLDLLLPMECLSRWMDFVSVTGPSFVETVDTRQHLKTHYLVGPKIAAHCDS